MAFGGSIPPLKTVAPSTEGAHDLKLPRHPTPNPQRVASCIRLRCPGLLQLLVQRLQLFGLLHGGIRASAQSAAALTRSRSSRARGPGGPRRLGGAWRSLRDARRSMGRRSETTDRATVMSRFDQLGRSERMNERSPEEIRRKRVFRSK